MSFKNFWNKYPEGMTLPEQFVNLLGYTKEVDDNLKNKTDKKGNHEGSWQGISRPTLSEEGMRGTVEKHIEDITKINTLHNTRESVVINLNDYFLEAIDSNGNEDWGLAFKYIFENVITNMSYPIIEFSGVLKVKRTIELPYGVGINGKGLPNSALVPTSDFIGEYVIRQVSDNAHINLKNIYINFENNPNVKGVFVKNPYDYSIMEMIVGGACGNTFIEVGGEKISQTLNVRNCIAYCLPTIQNSPYILRNLQEGYIENNKGLGSGQIEKDVMYCDGVVHTTFINNSFAHSNKRGLVLDCSYSKRLSGNLITGNLFENLKGEHAIVIQGNTSSLDYEGNNNQIIGNHYLSSTATCLIGGVSNSLIMDICKVTHGPGARRTFNINTFDQSVSTKAYGHCELKADGNQLIGNYKGTFDGNLIGTATLNNNINITVGRDKTSGIRWNASTTADYGLELYKDGVVVMKVVSGDIHNTTVGGGLRLISPNGSVYNIRVQDDGTVYSTLVQ